MTHRIAKVAGWSLILLSALPTAHAFPPYRSTDADTAGPGTIQLRLGLLRIKRTGSQSERSTPLTRSNFGIGDHFEIVSEFEYSPDRHELEEGALGFKWARLEDGFGIGVETLTLLPVHQGQGGAGIESQFIVTLERESWQLHVNGGLFHDPRSRTTERGWRASALAEFPRGNLRPGVELFAKKGRFGGARVQVGAGVISQVRRLQIRTGLHFGVTGAAPDIEASVWLAWSWDKSN